MYSKGHAHPHSMIRQIIKIDKGKCTGCGLCVDACHEGAIEMADGKAVLAREDFCDGLGDCLPACPAGAITFEEREAPAYDEAAVEKAKSLPMASGRGPGAFKSTDGELAQWPVQIKLVPVKAPHYNGKGLLIAADCAAYASGSFHGKLMKGRTTMIGCPKLDSVDYSEKLAAIISGNDITDILVAKMEVPCCSGLAKAVENAVKKSGKEVPVRIVTVSTREGAGNL